jgi:hypothetical protein
MMIHAVGVLSCCNLLSRCANTVLLLLQVDAVVALALVAGPVVVDVAAAPAAVVVVAAPAVADIVVVVATAVAAVLVGVDAPNRKTVVVVVVKLEIVQW